jgi:hypothetical protein
VERDGGKVNREIYRGVYNKTSEHNPGRSVIGVKVVVVRSIMGDKLNWILFGVVQIELLILLVLQESTRIRLKEWINWIKHVSETMNTILVEIGGKR